MTSYDIIQGMNMLVAVGLLFLDEETSFWLLTMIIEKMTPPDYYSPGLLGAQADQVCNNWSIIIVMSSAAHMVDHTMSCLSSYSSLAFISCWC